MVDVDVENLERLLATLDAFKVDTVLEAGLQKIAAIPTYKILSAEGQDEYVKHLKDNFDLLELNGVLLMGSVQNNIDTETLIKTYEEYLKASLVSIGEIGVYIEADMSLTTLHLLYIVLKMNKFKGK